MRDQKSLNHCSYSDDICLGILTLECDEYAKQSNEQIALHSCDLHTRGIS